MAYTYDDFLTEAKAAGMSDRFSQNDLLTAQKNPEYGISLLGLMKDVANSTTDEQRLIATEAANQLRKNYGVYNTGSKSADYSYASSYGSVIDDLMGKIKNYGSFSYDPKEDTTYSAIKKQYMREGERASDNAMTQAAAASGGVPSSYAVTAAQQAGNYYAGQLGDMLPSLEQNAYQEYLGNFDMLKDKLGTYQQQDATDYQRYLDAYNKQLQEEQESYQNALTMYKILGYATPEIAQILGIPARTNSGGSGVSSSNGTPVTKNNEDAEQESKLTVDLKSVLNLGYGPISSDYLNKLVASGDVKEYIDGNLIKFQKTEEKQAGNKFSNPLSPTTKYTIR